LDGWLIWNMRSYVSFCLAAAAAAGVWRVAAARGLLRQMQQQQQEAAASMDMALAMGCRCSLVARVGLLLQGVCLVWQMQQQLGLLLLLLLLLREVRGIKAGSTFLSA
jgi:hypothetical protein